MRQSRNKAQLNSSRYSSARNKGNFSWGRFLKKTFFWLLFLVFWVFCGWVLFFSNYTKIESVEVFSEKISKKELRKISENFMAEKWFGYIPKDNFFLFPRKTFAEKVKNDFKLVREVGFDNKFPNKIRIEVEERQEIVIWCAREKCWLLDEMGKVFYSLQPEEKDERFKEYQVVTDESHLEVEEGQKIESGDLIGFIEKSKREIEEQMDLRIAREARTPALISREIRFRVEEEDWEIYLNLDEDIYSQVSLLEEILESSINSQEREHLNYIDLRIPGKAIYNSSFQRSSQD